MDNVLKPIRYVALGDSYTICEGAAWEESWPFLLTQNLNQIGIPFELIANPSVTGWTTKDLIEKELTIYDESKPDFATLLIGVNDWVQLITIQQFKENLQYIISRMLSQLEKQTNLVLITIPDFGVTPKGANYSNGRNIADGISEFNQVIIEEAKNRNLKCIDIFPISQQMKDKPELISVDELHPSAKEYALWEELIFPVVANHFNK
ncbi:MAG: SGNH/GDSL hydrolase family protein [Bacteroidetes bacterium]|nr:SGNH/GDSL hydrolase family protein [Bacteroidota bacterium]MBK9801104.1 SGNH/GDSL hydrolase family protein [Bacteroidota bacterium]MBP6413201.1 SGNH/GDSL hydrolase family protein [Bacteroidia bacterium]